MTTKDKKQLQTKQINNNYDLRIFEQENVGFKEITYGEMEKAIDEYNKKNNARLRQKAK